jgi:Na+-driven multidrug efflux pump
VFSSGHAAAALQGVYRGLQDTRTPFYATAAATTINVVLGAVLIFTAGLGVKGAALATVISQVRRVGCPGQ